MNADEIVSALRDAEGNNELDCEISELRPLLLKAADLIESMQAQLAEYEDTAVKYGIDGKTMLTLAKSQIETAKENIVLKEHLKAEREKGCWACNDARRTGYTNMGSRIYIEKNEDGYVISDRFDNTVEVYCCPMCGKRLEVEP